MGITYSYTIGTNGWITTSSANQEITFTNPKDATKKVTANSITIKSKTTPFHYFINEDYDVSTSTGTLLHLDADDGTIIDETQITKITIIESGVDVKVEGLAIR